MQDIFATELTTIQLQGWGQLWQLLWREIRDWPGVVLQEHLRVWRLAMTQKSDFSRKPFVIWIVMNSLGFGALGVALLLLPSLTTISGFLGTILIISIPISLAQWIALRQIFPVSILWIISIPIGFLIYILLFREIVDGKLWQTAYDVSFFVEVPGFFVPGLLIGIPQWIILRQQFTNSIIWLLGSSVGTAAGFWLVLATDFVNQSPTISYIVAAIVYTTATGLVLLRLFTHHQKHQINMVNAA
jgi:hypothetical protein